MLAFSVDIAKNTWIMKTALPGIRTRSQRICGTFSGQHIQRGSAAHLAGERSGAPPQARDLDGPRMSDFPH
jgi:hypothetical protein